MSQDWSDFKSRLKNYAQNIAKNMALEVKKRLVAEAPSCIAAFYSTWTPDVYKRNYYNLMNNSYEPFYANPHNAIYRGGVRLSSNDMADIYRLPSDVIFDMAWFQGVHTRGTNVGQNWEILHQSPIPYELLQQEKEKILSNIEEIKNIALSQTKF